MALSRIYEAHEVSSDMQALYAGARQCFDLPFTPSIFKLLAAKPGYLKPVWADLHEVVCSSEFQNAAHSLEEYARSLIIHSGWRLSDQRKILSGLKFSGDDQEVVATLSAIFAKAVPQMLLFTRLLQLGFSGGQNGRVSSCKQPCALSKWFTLQVPPERSAGLRTWLIYSDIRRTLGTKNIFSLFRMLSVFPGYLAAIWVDIKKLSQQTNFRRACDDLSRRSRSLLNGLPVRDHRKLAKNISPQDWRDIEETVDMFARLVPQFALFSAVWQRSFEGSSRRTFFAA